eukprot:GFKZ01007257.1.p1 GENE.GFKZ01007257.1~~GFKZ01007257.1.p1  ORF type:complete len:695 (+),score=72.31 GFKZ01007257.1:452-2536(+)
MGPELKHPTDTKVNVHVHAPFPALGRGVISNELPVDKHHFPHTYRKFARRRPDLQSISRDFVALVRAFRRHAVQRFSHFRSNYRVTQCAVVLLGILLSLFVSAGTTFLAYHSNLAYFPPGASPAMSVTRPTVSMYTASKLSASLDDVSNGPHVENALERNFDFPPSLSRKISLAQRYSLLTQLQDISQRKRQYPLRLFILHVVGSHASGRLAAIASAITYARNTHRFLLILWDTGRGGEAFGTDAIRPLEACDKQSIMFTNVDSLQLSPNLTSWSEFQINYYTKNGSGGYSLDSVAALATRHIFYRSQAAVQARYAELSPGIMAMERLFAPGSSIERAWFHLMKDWTFPSMDISDVGDLLHRVYGVPLIFLDALSSDNKRKLLRGLSQSTSKRAFFVHAQYGLGNRLRALGSAMAVAKVTGRVLVLIWEPDVHLNCRFSDLFANDLIVMDKLNMNWPPGDVNTKDHAMRTVDFYNFMRFQGKHIHNPLKQLVNPRSGRHVYVKTAYVVRSSFAPRIISTTSAYWKVMRETLVANAEIMYLVHDPSFVNIRGMVGVHIRSRTIENDIKGVSEEFYGNGSRTTDHWRRLTGLKTFENKIMRLSLRYKFFVAADTREAISMLEKKFGSHRIFSLPREEDCMTRDVECAKLALADILLLSKVPTLLGSNWSSFTEGAVRLSGHVKVLLAGVHFGRKQG